MINKDLLTDMYYAAPEFWYLAGAIFATLIAVSLLEMFKILKLKQKNYFLNRDRERYAETLYASRDGYFAFIYPDQRINDPRTNIIERCSRRLAVIMNLPNGVKSSFADILKNFYKEDSVKIQKYVNLLHEDGVSFDDEFILKTSNKYIRLVGTRINGVDGNIYCDMIWFRDISFETDKISALEKAKTDASVKISQLQDMLNNLPFPVWLRNDKLEIINYNKKYAEFINTPNKEHISQDRPEITDIKGDIVAYNLSRAAHAANKPRKIHANIIKNGERFVMEATETPFHAEESLDKIYTVGSLIDISELDTIKRNLKVHQNAQLEILGTLGTAFAVFDQHLKLAFHNLAFSNLWQLEDSLFDKELSYAMFLDILREKRLLPEVPDYLMFKSEEQKKFSQILEPQKDMLHLPNGKTLRRLRAPYPAGGLIFAFEDITDRLATTSAYNALLSVQKEILENLTEGILIFSTTNRLKFYNRAYQEIWNSSPKFLDSEPTLDEVLDSHRQFFNKKENWKKLKDDIAAHILSMTTKSFILKRNNVSDLEVTSKNLSDGSIMIAYKTLHNN